MTDITTNGQKRQATVCINTYKYLTLDPNSFQGFDMILGDAFLRNVYASYVSSRLRSLAAFSQPYVLTTMVSTASTTVIRSLEMRTPARESPSCRWSPQQTRPR